MRNQIWFSIHISYSSLRSIVVVNGKYIYVNYVRAKEAVMEILCADEQVWRCRLRIT
jgi:hypothetical protein